LNILMASVVCVDFKLTYRSLFIDHCGAPLTKTDGKIDEQFGIWGWDKNYPTCHCLVDKTT
jgi:hypothetical protein